MTGVNWIIFSLCLCSNAQLHLIILLKKKQKYLFLGAMLRCFPLMSLKRLQLMQTDMWQWLWIKSCISILCLLYHISKIYLFARTATERYTMDYLVIHPMVFLTAENLKRGALRHSSCFWWKLNSATILKKKRGHANMKMAILSGEHSRPKAACQSASGAIWN